MNADDNTRLFDSEETTGKNRKKSNDNAKTYGAAAGAAAVGATAGVGAHAAYSAASEVEVDEDMDIEGAELAGGASAAAHSQTAAEPSHLAPAPAPAPTPASEPDHAVDDNGDTVQPLTDGQNPGNLTPENTVPGPSEIVEPVAPDEVIEDPVVATDEILAEEEIDVADIDAPEMVNFDSIGTVYTVDGEEFAAASFHMDNGIEGVMIDVDGDGVFDDVAAQTVDGLIKVGDAPGFTVDDVELELNPDDSYLAQNDEIDHTLADDSFADDIIDTSLA